MARAASSIPKLYLSMSAAYTWAHGLAIPLPAISGAVPPASFRKDRTGDQSSWWRFQGLRMRAYREDPQITASSSERMSPNIYFQLKLHQTG